MTASYDWMLLKLGDYSFSTSTYLKMGLLDVASLQATVANSDHFGQLFHAVAGSGLF